MLTPAKLAAKATEAGLSTQTLREIVFEVTLKTSVEQLKTAEETELVSRAINDFVETA